MGMILFVIGIIIILVVISFVYSRLQSYPTFTEVYNRRFKQTGSKETALEDTIKVFTQIYPYNQLGEKEIKDLVNIFCNYEYPQELGVVFNRIDKGKSDISILFNLTYMEETAKVLNEIRKNERAKSSKFL